MYCHGTGTKKNPNCKWRKYYGTVDRNRENCNFANECKEGSCTKCYNTIYRCEYLKYTDFTNESLLWDACKECAIKDY